MATNNTSSLLDFNLTQDAYATFDAVSLKDYIIKRLNENEKFTDQNYEGSNLAAVIDIVAFSYHVLLFYLNNTAAEVNYDQTTIYENMNKIVKLIGYKPTGKQTSIVSINAVATKDLPIGYYTIRKYSYFLVDGVQYTFLDDYSFNIATQEVQNIISINNNAILYQGSVGEYPDYTAQGEDFEVVTVVVDNIVDNNDDRFISENTIGVYVKEVDTDTYFEYKEVDSLYLSDSYERVYERRLNESGHYEIKFGDNINGKKLNEGDIVSINYILSDNTKGIISKNAINGNKLFVYDSQRMREIFNDTYTDIQSTTFLTAANSSLVNFNNPSNSTLLTEEETVEDIRKNATRLFNSQLRLVTSGDYESFFTKNYNSLVTSVKVVGNESFINEYIDYYYSICVDPSKSNRVLLNQVNFADSCDFNNVNVFVVPRFKVAVDDSYPEFLSTSLKNLIVSSTESKRVIGHEVIPRDPVYMAYGLGFTKKLPTTEVLDNTKLVIVRDRYNRVDANTLKNKIQTQIINFFSSENNQLGQNLSISNLLTDILNIVGVTRIYTTNTEENVSFDGISFISYNPAYPNSDVEIVNQNIQLPYFKFPYYIRPNSLSTIIEVVDE